VLINGRYVITFFHCKLDYGLDKSLHEEKSMTCLNDCAPLDRPTEAYKHTIVILKPCTAIPTLERPPRQLLRSTLHKAGQTLRTTVVDEDNPCN